MWFHYTDNLSWHHGPRGRRENLGLPIKCLSGRGGTTLKITFLFCRTLILETCFPTLLIKFVICIIICCKSEGKPGVDFPFIHLQPPQEKPPPVNKQENAGTLNILSTFSNGNSSKQKIPADGVHRIRVDFKVKAFCDHIVC